MAHWLPWVAYPLGAADDYLPPDLDVLELQVTRPAAMIPSTPGIPGCGAR